MGMSKTRPGGVALRLAQQVVTSEVKFRWFLFTRQDNILQARGGHEGTRLTSGYVM